MNWRNWHLKMIGLIIFGLVIITAIAFGGIKISNIDNDDKQHCSLEPITDFEKPKKLEPLIERILKEGINK